VPLERAAAPGAGLARSPFALGVIYCASAGVLYGTLVILGNLAYRTGITPLPLLFLRYNIAAAVMWVGLLALRPALLKLAPRDRAMAFGLGLVYATQSYVYFVGFQSVDPAVTGILFNTFPLDIAILAAIFLRERLGKLIAAALALGLAGAFLMTRPSNGSVDPFGATLILASAFGYSCYVVAARKTTAHLPSEAVAAHVFLGAAVAFTAAALVRGEVPVAAAPDSLAYAIALAIVATLLPILLFLKGLKLIGAARAGIIGTLEPLVTVVLAAAILGSTLGPVQMVGGALIIAASLMVHRAGARQAGAALPEVPRE
jgi:drug/metabolite transporter (DMT)-like permease